MTWIGKTISHYRITDRLGVGAMGVVYKAEDTRLGRPVALKFLPEDRIRDDTAQKRFLREAQASASIDHPNVCHVYEIEESPEGETFIVMAYCDGQTVRERIDSEQIPVVDALDIAAGVANGLAHAHARKIVHRDLKPGNLMLTADGTVKIVDFGIAMLTDRTRLTRSGMTLGTLIYMSPEQAYGKEVDARSDIFSLGVVLYELLAGSPPFSHKSEAAVLRMITDEPHAPIRELRAATPEAVEKIIDRALAKDPADRYQSADELRDDLYTVLREIAPERVIPHPSPTPLSLKYILRRHRKPLLAAAVAVTLLAVGIWQRDPILEWLGIGGPVRLQSIAVVPMTDGGPEQQVLVAGFARDVTDRIRRLTYNDRSLWAVPADQIWRHGVKTPEDAPGLVAATRAVTVRALPLSDKTAIELERYDVGSSPVSIGKIRLAIDEELDSGSIDSDLASLLSIEYGEVRAAGYTKNGYAYRAYLTGQGHLASQSPAVDAAIAALEEAVTNDSSFARAHATLGEAYRLKSAELPGGDWTEKARRACESALQAHPDEPDVHVTMGRLQFAQQDATAAIASFEAALEVDGRHPEALNQLGYVYAQTGEANSAEAIYTRATESNPANITAHEVLAFFYYSQTRYQEAIAQWLPIAERAPDYGQTYNYLGACYFSLSCWDQATAMFEKSFNLGRNYLACANLGLLYYLQQRFTDAAGMYEWMSESVPGWYLASGNLADAKYWIPGERERAIELYKDAAKLAEADRAKKPDDAHLLTMLAGYYAMIDKPDTASTLLDRALAVMPDDALTQYQAAVVSEVLGEREKALIHLGRCVDLDYSLRQIESERFLADLREDPRYQLLRQGVDREEERCEITD
ncbi:MAG: protein kinase [Candidatus Krumholzibacteria bacterium]|nr:protein kinase [Candidatus Krumholzibacteria bacterium]